MWKLLPVLVLVGCASPGMIHVSAVKPLMTQVMDRHDVLVTEKDRYSDAQKKVYLESTKKLRTLIETAEK